MTMALTILALNLAGCCKFWEEVFDWVIEDPNTDQISIRTDDPLSGQIPDDSNLPYDRPAVLAAISNLIEPDLSGYRFALLMVFQNMFNRDVAFDVYVNGQRIERRKVLAVHQEIVPITNQIVLDTEAITGIQSTPRFGKPTPFVVTFANFVCSDDHIINDQSFLLAPLNAFRTNLAPVTKDEPPLRLQPVYVCPSIIMIVIEKTRLRAIELDREFTVPDYQAFPQEPADPGEELFPMAADIIWAAEEVNLLNLLNKGYLLVPY